ncbi:MAG: OsmC family protein [Candidatus Aerophobetes bacterium]|nr:OsmC family protein [Candidatus Aerophobetes bacterium]
MVKSKQFIYKNELKWTTEKRGLLNSEDKPPLEVACPPDFGGHYGIWAPEDLLVASVNICIMTTFLYYAKKQKLEFLSYQSYAEGTVEIVEKKLVFSTIEVKPKILVTSDKDVKEAKRVLRFSERNCLVSNSIKSRIILNSEVKVDSQKGQ